MTVDATLQPGQVFAGRFRIERVIGRGGFGVVYQAVQLPIERRIALKVLLPAALGMDQGFARFRREAELAQQLEHPHTVRLYDFGTAEDGSPFIAWELLAGEGLDQRLQRAGPMSLAQTIHIGRQVLKSLMDAHERGIVHRDIKPSNLFLCRYSGDEDFVKVLDFGIAKSTVGGGSAPMTEVGRTVGTPRYMSPEQAFGKPVGPPADLYSLALVLAEVMTGTPVMQRATVAELLMAIVSPEPVQLPALVKLSPIGPILERATHKSLELRTPTAAAMLAELDAVSDTMRSGSVVLSGAQPPPALGTGLSPVALTAGTPAGIAAPPTPATTLPSARSGLGKKQTGGAGWLLIALLGALVAGAGAGLWLMVSSGDAPSPRRAERDERRSEKDKDKDKRKADEDDGETDDGETDDGETDDGETDAPAPPIGPSFRGVTPEAMRRRIEAEVGVVLKQHVTEHHVYWIVRSTGGEGTVDVEAHGTAAGAANAEATLRRVPGCAVVRDGNTLLSVQHPTRGEAERLLPLLAGGKP